MFYSGTDHHLVGEGTMGPPNEERKGLPGYEGYLNNHALSVAELLHDAGYHTYIAGKWKILWTEPPTGPVDGQWQLFDIEADRAEIHDVSAQHPEVVKELYQHWQTYLRLAG